jgi:hypothetical protein
VAAARRWRVGKQQEGEEVLRDGEYR